MRLDDLDLTDYRGARDPALRGRLALAIHTATGAAASAVIAFEHEPGQHHGRHTDSAEEVVLVLEGEAEVTLGDERLRLGPGGMAVVPPLVPHDVANVGDGRLRAVGFFAAAAVVSRFDEALLPYGTADLVIGAPDAGGPAMTGAQEQAGRLSAFATVAML